MLYDGQIQKISVIAHIFFLHRSRHNLSKLCALRHIWCILGKQHESEDQQWLYAQSQHNRKN